MVTSKVILWTNLNRTCEQISIELVDKSLSKMSVVTPAAPELQVNTFLDDLLNLEAIEVRR